MRTDDTVDLLPQEPEDSIEWEVQYTQDKEYVRNNIETLIDETVDIETEPLWLIYKIYYMLYAHPAWDKEIHINRVRPTIEKWLSVTKYRELIEMGIINQENFINNYKL